MLVEKVSNVRDEAAALLRQVAEPRPVGDSVKAAIGRSARRLGFSWRDQKPSGTAKHLELLRRKWMRYDGQLRNDIRKQLPAPKPPLLSTVWRRCVQRLPRAM